MTQFEEDLAAAKFAISQIFSSRLALEFMYVIEEGEYDENTLIDDIQDENDSNIIDGLININTKQLEIFPQLIIEIFKHHNHDISSLKFCISPHLFCARI